MTLTEFLMARIADTERAWGASEFRARLDPLGDGSMSMADRVLARCEADRRIVETHRHLGGYGKMPDVYACPREPRTEIDWTFRDGDSCDTLRLLAAVYADHPDYQEA